MIAITEEVTVNSNRTEKFPSMFIFYIISLFIVACGTYVKQLLTCKSGNLPNMKLEFNYSFRYHVSIIWQCYKPMSLG